MRAAHEVVETARLVLRRPQAGDADAILARCASDPEVTRLVGWPRQAQDERGVEGSARVLETCEFSLEGLLRGYVEFPNLVPIEPREVLCFATLL